MTHGEFASITAPTNCAIEQERYPQNFATDYGTDDKAIPRCIERTSHGGDDRAEVPTFCTREEVDSCDARARAESCQEVDYESETPCFRCYEGS